MPNRDQRMLQLMQLLEFIQGNKTREQQNALGYAGLERQGVRDQGQDALARLGLTQQGEHQQALEALGLRQAAAQESQQQQALAHQQALLAQQGQFHKDTMGLQKAAQEQAMLSFLGNQTNETAKLGLTAAMDQQRQERQLQQQMMDNYTKFSSATPEGLARMGKNFNVPGAEAWLAEGQDEIANRQVNTLKAAFGPTYSNFAKNPHASQEGLNALWQDPTMQSPTIQAKMLPWLQQQNESLYQGPNVNPPTTQVGTGVGASVGYGLRHAPTALVEFGQNADSAMTDMGSNFWGNLLDIKPPTTVSPAWQDTIDYAIQQKKIRDAKGINPDSFPNTVRSIFGMDIK